MKGFFLSKVAACNWAVAWGRRARREVRPWQLYSPTRRRKRKFPRLPSASGRRYHRGTLATAFRFEGPGGFRFD